MSLVHVTSRRGLQAGVVAVALGLAALASAPLLRVDAGPLPERLTNEEFWGLVESFSEPSGYFQSDNLVSNEHSFQYVAPSLEHLAQPGGVYLGVAPDQNFTYILALKPQLAFIVDIRRGADLMRQHDGTGMQRGYLASETQFQALKTMQMQNLIVPVVGDFAGPTALRAVGKYVRDRGALIGAFYTSNVEQYLFRNGVWRDFYANLATLPVDDRSVIIRSVAPRDGYAGPPQGPDGRANVLDPIATLIRDVKAGKVETYYDITSRVY